MSCYLLGKHHALLKLGMLSGSAGAVEGKPTGAPPIVWGNSRGGIWNEIDREPAPLEQEKEAADDYSQSTSGGTERAGGDAYQNDPERDHRLSSDMQESFRALDNYDVSYGPEPAITQPHGGPKYAMSGVSSISAASAVAPPPPPRINAGAPKPPKAPRIIGNTQQGVHNNLNGIDTADSAGSVNRRLTGSAL